MRTKKALLAALCACLLVVGSVMGTLAYLSDTETVTNTFTVGHVDIALDEAETDATGYGEEVDAGVTRVQENVYKMVPGHTYAKDPTVHVQNDSESCYIFVQVQNGISGFEAEGDTTIAAQIDANGWEPLTDENVAGEVYYKVWTRDESNLQGATDLVVFEQFKIDSALTNADLDGYNAGNPVVVTAYAIQNDGLTVAAAWTSVQGTAEYGVQAG